MASHLRQCYPKKSGLFVGGQMQDRLPPHDMDAEESVIGALLIADADIYFYGSLQVVNGSIPQSAIDYHQAHLRPAVSATMKLLEPENFYRERHGWIFQAVAKVKAHGGHVDEITVARQLALDGKLEACGGRAYLTLLVANCPTTAFLLDYAKIVKDTSLLRRQIGQAHIAEEAAYQGKSITPKAKGGMEFTVGG